MFLYETFSELFGRLYRLSAISFLCHPERSRRAQKRMPFQSLTQIPKQKMKFKTYQFFVSTIVTLLFFTACKFNKVQTSTGEAFLQGKWSEDSLENESQLVSYQHFDFTFTCDSFYTVINNFSKADLQGGECYDKGTWKEYAKGYYKVAGDTLKFDGNFVDMEFKYKTQGSCYRSGKFTDSFLINNKTDSIFTLKSLETGTLHQLLLKEKLSCE